MKLEMIVCPKCGNDFPKLRKEKYGYHVCVNCSTVEPVVGITTVEGSGDHTYNDIIIMPQSKANAIAAKEAALLGKKIHLELLDLDKDERAVSQSVNEKVGQIFDEDNEEQEPEVDDGNNNVRGIDY